MQDLLKGDIVNVLIPSEQGKCSNRLGYQFLKLEVSLNPFGTGKVFKQLIAELKGSKDVS